MSTKAETCTQGGGHKNTQAETGVVQQEPRTASNTGILGRGME